MKFNKALFNARLSVLVNMPASPVMPCVKLPIDQLVLPQTPALMNNMHVFMPKTAEQPNGCKYDVKKYQSMVRVIDGKLLFDDPRRDEDGYVRTDNYCWTIEKVQNYVDNGKAEVINNTTEEGRANKEAFLQTIISADERQMMADMLGFLNADFLLVHDGMSNRFCIRITQELYDAGWNFCVDEWMKVDDNGEADTTQLFVGDVLIVTHNDDGSISGYRVAKEIFELTYSY